MNQITEKEISDLIIRSKMTGIDREFIFSKFFTLLKANPEDMEVYELLIEKLKEAEIEALVNPDPFRKTNPISYELPGNILLGQIPPKGVPYTIYPDILTTHLLLVFHLLIMIL